MKRVICALLACALLAQSLPLSANENDTPFGLLEEASRTGDWVEVVYVRKSRRMVRSGFVSRIRDEFVYISRSEGGRGRKIPIEDVLSVNVGYTKVVSGALVRVKAPTISRRPLEGLVTTITPDSLTIRSEKALHLNAIRERGKLPVFVSIPALQPFPISLESIKKLEVRIGGGDWDRVPIAHIRLSDGATIRDVAAYAQPTPVVTRKSERTLGRLIRLRTPDLPQRTHVGHLMSVGSDSIVVLDARASSERVAVPLRAISGIRVRTWKRKAGSRAAKGFLIGVAAGGLLGFAAPAEPGYQGMVSGALAVVVGGLGALVGAISGAKASPAWQTTTVEELRLQVEH